MIKKSFILMAFVLISQYGFCQSIDNLFHEFSRTAHAETVNLGGFLTRLLKPLAKELKGVDSIKVLDMESCSDDAKERFTQKAKKLKFNDYETLVRSNEDGESTKVLVKIKDETIHELVVITTGKDCCLVKIKGKFKQSDINSLASN